MKLKNTLALYGGQKIVEEKFQRFNSYDHKEVQAATAVIKSGKLSEFLGSWGEQFLGGPRVRDFERACAEFFQVRNAVVLNSWTSGLVAAVGAIAVEPGDEVIVSPWTMSASAMAILHWNAIPVFVDIDPLTFCLDPSKVEDAITDRTVAIMSIDIHGKSAEVDKLMLIAKKHGLTVISDSAQSPGGKTGGRYTGTVSHIGGFSLNYHKHIHTGEGGIIVTNDDVLAERVCLIRNHAESVVGAKGETNLTNLIGHNFRMTEIEAAMGIEQLKKLPSIVEKRTRIAKKLISGLQGLKGLYIPEPPAEADHVFYLLPFVLDLDLVGTSRDKICTALTAEGVTGIQQGYTNIHRLPIFTEKIAYGSKGFPWTADFTDSQVKYGKGVCPEAEKLHDHTFFSFLLCLYELDERNIEQIILAFEKVWDHLEFLS